MRKYTEDSESQVSQVTKEGASMGRRKQDKTVHVDLELEAQ